MFRKSVNYLLSVALAALVLAACNNQPPADTTPPTVSLTSSSTNVTAAGPVTFTATASDNVGVSKLEFYEGTTKLSEKVTAPYTFELSYAKADNGQHSYTAKAYDAANNSTTSSPVTVTVNIAPAAGAPVITSFSAAPANLPAGGGNVTLAWEVTGATALSIDQGVGDVTGLTQKPVEVTTSTTFTLTATNVADSVKASASITVNPTPGTTGSLTVTVDGLPEGLEAAVTVTGPEGYSQALMASATLTELTPGTYTVTAEPVPSDGDSYAPDLTSQDVSVSADNTATATVTYALVQTQFYVDPVNGADSSPGTKSEPFKTLKYALSVIQGGQTIILNAGTYDGASGEDFGYTVPEGVIIKANSTGVVLSGLPAQEALSFAGSGELHHLAFKGFSLSLRANTGEQKLVGVSFEGKRGMNWSGDATATLQDCVFETDEVALWVSYTSRVDMTAGKLADSRTNLIVQQLSGVSLRGTEIVGGTIDVNQSSSLYLENVKLSDVDAFAIYVRAGQPFLSIKGGSFTGSSQQASVILSEGGTVTIDGAGFSSNGTAISASGGNVTLLNSSVINSTSYGIVLGDGVAFKMRNTQVAGNASGGGAVGILVGDLSGGIDLGTSSDPGNNTLQSNGSTSLSISATSGTVQAVGNTWTPNEQGADAAGHYSSQLYTPSNAYDSGKNFYLKQGAYLQF